MRLEDFIGILVISIFSYLLGSISFATIFSKLFKNINPREHGSKNPGTTNVLRVAGFKAAIFTLIFDVLKGVVPVLFSVFLAEWTNMDNGYILPLIAAVFAVLGHMYPVYYKFKGGKGIATGIGVILVINWHIAIILIVFVILVILLSKFVSLGSISGALLYFVLSMFLSDANILNGNIFAYILTAFILSSLMIFKHKENIKRLKAGEENKISFQKKNEN